MPPVFWWAMCGFGALAISLSTFLWQSSQRFNERLKETDIHFKAKAAHPRVNELMERFEQQTTHRRCVIFTVGLALLSWGIYALTR